MVLVIFYFWLPLVPEQLSWLWPSPPVPVRGKRKRVSSSVCRCRVSRCSKNTLMQNTSLLSTDHGSSIPYTSSYSPSCFVHAQQLRSSPSAQACWPGRSSGLVLEVSAPLWSRGQHSHHCLRLRGHTWQHNRQELSKAHSWRLNVFITSATK